jgi:hypothetical protein
MFLAKILVFVRGVLFPVIDEPTDDIAMQDERGGVLR